MRTLNKAAAEAIAGVEGVHACTDITGFGLIGHASEMAAASQVTIAINAAAVPLIPGVLEMVGQNKSGGMNTNREHFGPGVDFGTGVERRAPRPLFRSANVGRPVVGRLRGDRQLSNAGAGRGRNSGQIRRNGRNGRPASNPRELTK